ncbi:MAG TPA: translesion DNA synthesis-associated protein ImuA [Bordetella sp.]
MTSASLAPEHIHPALWRASQLSRAPGRYAPTGIAALSAQLPGGGWPRGNLTELLVQQAGVGELHLLRSALLGPDARPIVLVRPPHAPQAAAWAGWGADPARLVWLRPERDVDALWAAELAVRSSAFAAVLLWQNAMRAAAVRRLQLAAQSGDALFVVVRPLAAAAQASAAPLRLALAPVPGGVSVRILKRRGSVCDAPILVPLYPARRIAEVDDASLDSRAPAAREPGQSVPTLAN